MTDQPDLGNTKHKIETSCLDDCKQAQLQLESYGLQILAMTQLTTGEQELLGTSNQSVCIIGNVGPSIWPCFSQSPEFKRSIPNPLDTWTKRLLNEIFAGLLKSGPENLVFPSDGPPYAPFQKWAFRSGVYWTSPISIALHERYGLWTAFRGAVLLDPEQALAFEKLMPSSDLGAVSPCLTCKDKPCLTTCPVGAFRMDADTDTHSVKSAPKRLYDVASCRKLVLEQSVHSKSQDYANEQSCFDSGCLARRACPVGKHLVYEHEQVKFHMERLINPSAS